MFFRITLVLAIFVSSLVSSQNDEFSAKSQWIFTTNIGSAIVEAKKAFKVNSSTYEGLIGREFVLGKRISLITGFEILRVRASFIDDLNNSQFLTNEYVSIPVSFQFAQNRDKNIFLFFNAGVYVSYLNKSKTEDVLNDIITTKKKLGYNFGIQSKLGIRFKINEVSNFSLAFNAKTDVSSNYKSTVQEFELKDYYAIQLGFGFSF